MKIVNFILLKINFILSVLILFLGIWSFFPPRNFIEFKDPNLPEYARQTFQNNIEETQRAIDGLTRKSDRKQWFTGYLNLGRNNFWSGNLAKAEKAYKKSLKYAENSIDTASIWDGLYNVLISAEDYNGARHAIVMAAYTDPTHAPYWLAYAVFEQKYFNADSNKIRRIFNIGIKKSNNSSEVISAYEYFKQTYGQ